MHMLYSIIHFFQDVNIKSESVVGIFHLNSEWMFIDKKLNYILWMLYNLVTVSLLIVY